MKSSTVRESQREVVRVTLRVQAKCGHWDRTETWLLPGNDHRVEIPNGYSDYCMACWAKQDEVAI